MIPVETSRQTTNSWGLRGPEPDRNAPLRGIVLGDFPGCEEKEAPYSSADVLRELAVATGLPCAAGFPIGHGEQNQPVPLGVRVRLDAGERSLTFLESAAT